MTAKKSRVTSVRAAARLVGVTAPTVQTWIGKGWLPDTGSWTPAQVERASRKSRQTAGRGSSAAHGSPSQWRAGCNCATCREGHNARLALYRKQVRLQEWAEREDTLIDAIAQGVPYAEAVEAIGVRAQTVTAHRRRDPEFADRLDEALMASRNPHLRHGTSGAWNLGCRCPECRDYHEGTR